MVSLSRISKIMGASLKNAAKEKGVSLEGITYKNFNEELDKRFNDGGQVRCEKFCDISWDYALQFGPFDSEIFNNKCHEAIKEALRLLK